MPKTVHCLRSEYGNTNSGVLGVYGSEQSAKVAAMEYMTEVSKGMWEKSVSGWYCPETQHALWIEESIYKD